MNNKIKVYLITPAPFLAAFITLTVLMKKGVIPLKNYKLNSIITGMFFSLFFMWWVTSLLINDIKKKGSKEEPRFAIEKYMPLSSILAFTVLATLIKSGIIIKPGVLSGSQVNNIIVAIFFSTLFICSNLIITSNVLKMKRSDVQEENCDTQVEKLLNKVILSINLSTALAVGFIAFAVMAKQRLFSVFNRFTNGQINGLIAGSFFAVCFAALSISTLNDLDNQSKDTLQFLGVVLMYLTIFTVFAALIDNGVFKGLDHLTRHQRGGVVFALFVAEIILTFITLTMLECMDKCAEKKPESSSPQR